MTAPHHAAARSMPAEALDSLLTAIATLAAAISDAARYLRARAAMRLRWPSLFPRPRQDESATEWLSRTGQLGDEAEAHVAAMTPEAPAPCVAVQAESRPGDHPRGRRGEVRAATPTDAATDVPPSSEAARQPAPDSPPSGPQLAPPPLPGPPPGQGRRDTWVTWQDPPGTPRPVLAVRRDGVIGIDGHGHITIEPAGTRPAATTLTGPQPMMTIRTITRPNVAAEPEPEPYGPTDIVRPWLAITGDRKRAGERYRPANSALWINARNARDAYDAALAARGGTR